MIKTFTEILKKIESVQALNTSRRFPIDLKGMAQVKKADSRQHIRNDSRMTSPKKGTKIFSGITPNIRKAKNLCRGVYIKRHVTMYGRN